MRAVVLGAGRGSRMGLLTADRPKCLIEIGGASLLDRQIAALQAASVSEVAIVTGWRREQFSETPHRLFHNPRWHESNMVDSLACAEEWLLDGPTLVCYGDIVFSPAAVEAVLNGTGTIVVAYDPDWAVLWSRRFDDPLTDAETFRLAHDGRLTDIGKEPRSLDEVEGQYVGMLKLEPDGWRAVKAELAACSGSGARRDTTAVLGRLVARGSPVVRAVAVPGPWHEFDSPRDVELGVETLDRLDCMLSHAPGANARRM